MIESAAYPCGREYGDRLRTRYQPRDRVRVGPAFCADGYILDGHEGTYYVVGYEGNSTYALAVAPDQPYCDYITAARLTPTPRGDDMSEVASDIIRIRVKPEVKAGLQRAAALDGMTLSEYMLACAALGLEKS